MTTHAHHWRIEEANGTPIQRGVCKVCGATREFRADLNLWDSWREQNEQGGFASLPATPEVYR